MEWFEALGIIEGCKAGAISEARAEELLREHKDHLRIIANHRNEDWADPLDTGAGEVSEGGRTSVLSAPRPGNIVGAAHPYFNRLMRVRAIAVDPREKIVEWEDGSLEKVQAKVYSAFSEAYTWTDADGNVRRTQDEVRSGPERFAKDPVGGPVMQFGAATSLLARLLEVAALRPAGV